jgi:hypothetical protein
VVALLAGAGDAVELAEWGAGGHWFVDWLAGALGQEVAGLADAADSVPLRIGRAGGNVLALPHNILATFDTHAGLLGVAIDLVLSAEGNAVLPAHSRTVSAVAANACALNTVEELVLSTGRALVVDEEVAGVADTDAVVGVTVGAAAEGQACTLHQPVILEAEAAVGFEVEVAVGRAGEGLLADPVAQHQTGVAALALALHHQLALGTVHHAHLIFPVHVVPPQANALRRQRVVLAVHRTTHQALLGAWVVGGADGAGAAEAVDEEVSGGTLALAVEGVDLRTGAAVHALPLLQTIALEAGALNQEGVVAHVGGTLRTAELAGTIVALPLTADSAYSRNVEESFRALAASEEGVELLLQTTVVEALCLAVGEDIVELSGGAPLALSAHQEVPLDADTAVEGGVEDLLGEAVVDAAEERGVVVLGGGTLTAAAVDEEIVLEADALLQQTVELLVGSALAAADA